MNKFSIYQYLLIVVILLVGFIYALPNLYPTQPSIQIAYTDAGRSADQSLLNELEEILESLKRDSEKQEMVLEKPEVETEELQTNQPSPIPQEQSPQTVTRDEPKYGRNEIVKITNGQETKE